MEIKATAPYFREEQPLRQSWIWLIVLGATAVPAALFASLLYRQLILRKPWGEAPMSDAALIALCAMAFVLIAADYWFLSTVNLITEVRSDGLYVRFYPFGWVRYPFERIRKVEVCTYHPILGLGYRWSWNFEDKFYTISGNRGVRIELTDGKRLLIGSQREYELWAAIETYRKRGDTDHA